MTVEILWTYRALCGAGEGWRSSGPKVWEMLHKVKEERDILHTIKRRKANLTGYILHRNCLLKHVIEGKVEGRIEVTGRWQRTYKQLLNDLKEMRGYCKLKDEVLDCNLWPTRFGRGYGPVVIQTTEWMTNDRASFSNYGLWCVSGSCNVIQQNTAYELI